MVAESDHITVDLMARVKSVYTTLENCAPVRAAHKSSQGIDSRHLGATQDLTITNDRCV